MDLHRSRRHEERLGDVAVGLAPDRLEGLRLALKAGATLDDQPLPFRQSLISTHPGEFLAYCFAVGGETFNALAEDTKPKRGPRRRGEDLPKEGPLDFLFAGLFDIAFFVLCVAWLIVIAPIQYFGNLVAGAPARLALALEGASDLTSPPDHRLARPLEPARVDGRPARLPWLRAFADPP